MVVYMFFVIILLAARLVVVVRRYSARVYTARAHTTHVTSHGPQSHMFAQSQYYIHTHIYDIYVYI